MRRVSSLFILLFLFVLFACAGTDVKKTPSASDQLAPDLTLADQDGKAWKLSNAVKDYRAVVARPFIPRTTPSFEYAKFVEFQQNNRKIRRPKK